MGRFDRTQWEIDKDDAAEEHRKWLDAEEARRNNKAAAVSTDASKQDKDKSAAEESHRPGRPR